jgi:hypothetical protein
MTETGPRRIVIGSYESGAHLVVIPKGALRPAEQILDREREKREKLASEAKTRALQQAKNRGRLKRALAACFHRGGRGR